VSKEEILSCPNENPVNVLPLATPEMVKQFCVSDDINRVKPGTNYCDSLLTQKARRFILTHD
jgi:hypothetical protein